MITIYNKNNEDKLIVGVDEGSIRKYTLMKDDYIKLKFTTTENIPLLIGDYVDLTSYIQNYDNENFTNADDNTTKLFIIDRNYNPKFNSENGGYSYDVQINAYYYLWDNKVFMYNAEHGNAESSFNLTDNIETHAQQVIDNLAEINQTYKGAPIHVEIDGELLKKGIKLITYSSVSILGAIKLIAETYECEWWVDTNTLHFGYRKMSNEEIPLRMHEEIKSGSTSKADGTYATRLYAFGGTTNIPQHYRDALDFKVTEKGSDYIYDKNKPVKPSMFIDTTPAPIESYKFSSKSSESDLFDTYISEVVIPVGSITLAHQKYYGNVKRFNPSVAFTKVVTHGTSNTNFSVRFKYGLRIVGNGMSEELCSATTTITDNPYGMMQYRNSNKRDARKGFIRGSDQYFGENAGLGANEYVSVFESGKVVVGEVLASKNNVIDPHFYVTGETDLHDKDFYKFYPLAPQEGHIQNTWYSIYVANTDKYTSFGTVSNLKEKDEGVNAWYDLNAPKTYRLGNLQSSYDKPLEPPVAGEYNVELFVKVDGHSNIAIYNDGKSPLLTYNVNSLDVELDVWKNGYAKDTQITYQLDNGEWASADVTLNPNFFSDIDSGSSMLKFKNGSAIPVGTTFRFPEIIRSEVIRQGHGDWFTAIDTNNVKNSVIQRNLMLPEGYPYVQVEGVSDEDAVESIVVYDWIYPKTEMVVEKVIPFQVPVEGEKQDRWAIRIKDKEFNEKVFEPNATTYIIFQNGASAGLKYEAEWVSSSRTVSTKSGNVTLDTNDFILLPNTDWGQEIPNAAVLPTVGNKLIIEGLDLAYFDFGAISDAENELLSQALKDLAETSKENVVVDITLNSGYSYDNGRIDTGASVNIKGLLATDFPSRIIGYEEKLDMPYDSPKYMIGENSYYSRYGGIETKLSEVQKESVALSSKGAGGKGVVILTTADKYTRPSDANVLSAARVEERFLHTDIDDEVQGNIEFKKNINVSGDTSVTSLNVSRNISVDGDSHVSGESVVGSQVVEGVSVIEGDQRVKGRLSIDGGTLTDAAIIVGDYFEQGDTIQGARINRNGVASFAGVRTPSLQVYELVYNRKTAVQGEFVFSDGDTVETVTYILEDGTEYTSQQVEIGEFTPEYTTKWNFQYIRLGLKVPYEGYTTTMKEYDILYSNINNIGASGESATTGKCFLRILADDEIPGVKGVEDDGITLNVMHYLDEYTPSRFNMLPTPHMTITRHGNEVNTSRQDLFLISSEDGRIAQLTGIDSPIVKHDSSYGIVLGRLPYNLIEYIRQAGYAYVKEDQPYLYARGAVIQDLIRIDYKGKVIKTENYRGMWSQSIANGEIEGEDKYASTDIMYDTVTHDGSLWRCNKNETTEEPRGGINDWLLLIAKGDDGKDGKDGLTANPNIIPNSNFDLVDSNNYLTDWYYGTSEKYLLPKSNRVVFDDELVSNSFITVKTKTQAPNAKIDLNINIKAGIKYTLSWQTKWDSSTGDILVNSMASGIVIPKSFTKSDGTIVEIAGKVKKISSKNVRALYSGGNYDIHGPFDDANNKVDTTLNKDKWIKHIFTFEVTEDLPVFPIWYYVWGYNTDNGTTYYFAQPKLELGSEATPYQKAQDDLKGQSVNIVSTSVKYAKHTSGTSKPTSWSDTMPTEMDGYYLWTWTRVEYSTGNVTDSYSVSRMGIDGKGIKSAITKYCQKENTDVIPENFEESVWGEFPSSLKDGWWLYSRTITTYSDGSTSKSYNVTQNGQGSYYAGLQEYYAASSSSSVAPTGYPTGDIYASGADMPITGDWSKTRPTLTDEKPYLWNFSVSFDSKGNRYVVAPVCIGNFAKGIKSIVETYAISASSTADKGSYPSDITSWTDEQQNATPTESKPYQWNKTETTYNDDSKQIIYHVSAVKGADGKDGENGKDGADAGNTYELIPNPGVIYVRKDKTMTASKITMAVGETTPHGFVKIASNEILATRNLSVDYAIDGGTRKSLDNFSTGVSLSYGQEQVIFYLKSTSGEDVTETVVQLVYEGSDGINGKDGLTAKANLLANTNFDLLESDGETLQIWKYYDSSVGTMVPVKKSDLVIEGVGLGFNAVHKTASSATLFMQSKQVVNLQPNVVYTLSCYSKFDGEYPNSSSNANLNTYGYGIILAGTAASKITYKSSSKVSNTNFGSTNTNSEIYFGVNWGNKTDWVRHSVTFSVTEAIPSMTLRFHIWAANTAGNTFYYSQPKLEVGSEATPYLKNQEDLAGASAITTHSEPSVIGTLVDATEQTLINNKEYQVSVYAATPFGNLSTDAYTISIPSVTNVTFGTPEVKDGKYRFSVKLKDGITRNAIPEYFNVNFTKKDGTSIGSHSVSITTAERGFVGKTGSSGAMILPAGNWSEDAAYKLMREGDDIIGRPLVYYKASNANEGKNYVLKKDVPAFSGITVTNGEYWTPVEEFEYIFTEALLANFARLGGPQGGIFFKRYLFSQYGHNDSYFYDITDSNSIFDENDNFNGTFIPKLHLDFLNGMANLSCLCEPFNTPTTDDGYLMIEPQNGFNVKVPFRYGNLYPSDNLVKCWNPFVVLPQFAENDQWLQNGAHITVMYEHGGAFWGNVLNTGNMDNSKAFFTIVCVDKPITKEGMVETSFQWNGNYIINKGRRAKYLILAPGASVKFRAVKMDGYMLWYVENEGAVTEEKVDVYNYRGTTYTPSDFNNVKTSSETGEGVSATRLQFYGADYSDDVNLKTDYHGVATRSVMLYAGPRGYCPKNIVVAIPSEDYNKNKKLYYRLLKQSQIKGKWSGGPLLG